MSQNMSYEIFLYKYKNQSLYSKRNLGYVTLYDELHDYNLTVDSEVK